MKIVIAGGSGFIGQALVARLIQENHQVILLTRKTDLRVANVSPNLQYQTWNAVDSGPWKHHLTWADAVINLCGESVIDRAWSPKRKIALHQSRIGTTRTLVQALEEVKPRPQILINASAIGFYGNTFDSEVIESHRKGRGFLADLSENWENEAVKAESLGIRVIRLRIGIVLEKSGGALAKMIPIFRLGLGGPLGSGKQWISWIHLKDLVNLILYALIHPNLSGAINAVTPNPVRMKDFSKSLGEMLHRPAFLPVPGFLLHLFLGQRASMLLEGQKVVPEKLLKIGFSYQYPQLNDALMETLEKATS